MPVTVDELTIADPASAWTAAGFIVDPDGVCAVGGVRLRLSGQRDGAGIAGWSLRGLPSDAPPDDLDGIPTTRSDTPAAASAGPHPNGAVVIDHIVLLSPDLDRTVGSLGAVGMEPRRQRDAELGGRPIRQIFFRFADVVVEVVGSPTTAKPDAPSTLWGITYSVADIEATATFFGDRTSPVKDAVQPGRRITTLRNQELGMSVRTAFISARR